MIAQGRNLVMLMGFSSSSHVMPVWKVDFVDWTNACVDFHAYGPLEELSPWWLPQGRWPVLLRRFHPCPGLGQHLPPVTSPGPSKT